MSADTHSSSATGPLDIEGVLEKFEDDWRQGTPPRIEPFLEPASRRADDPGRRRLLEELICIDLDYRWREIKQGSGNPPSAQRPSLHDYVHRFPELGGEGMTLSLVASEYRIRKHWGDRPKPEEFRERFPHVAAKLLPRLAEIDAELAADVAEIGEPPLAMPVAEAAVPTPECIGTVSALLDILRQTGLLSAPRFGELMDLQERFTDPHALAQELVLRDWLTPYQVSQLFRGRGSDLILNSYVVREHLGEGGTGEVFKAWHEGLQRVVALKVIRKELLTDPEVVSRFYREIRLVSQLTSPHVVHAYDAGPVGPTHFLTMEYLKGTDLRNLVKTSGPLPIPQAVDYIRQAALGLQHIFENRQVHRDIKPSNLFVVLGEETTTTDSKVVGSSPPPIANHQIKILDLGLGRWLPLRADPSSDVPCEGNSFSSLTPAGSVMIGTPDYLAPEQALDFHATDIRADLYSLGCTLYYLVTGQPPFPGGTLAQKLLMHQQASPAPLEQFRTDLPPGLSAVVERMMAKRPADRFATPAELASVLTDLANFPPIKRNGRLLDRSNDGDPATARELFHEFTMPDADSPEAPRSPFSEGRRTRRPVLLGGGILVLALVIFVYLLASPLPAPSTGSTGARVVPTERSVKSQPISIWGSSKEVPAEVSDSDPKPVELGVKFRAAVNGLVTGVRFYKTPKNTGPHFGSLWSHTGKRLAGAAFTQEDAQGWQQADFARPVAIQANTTYVASYHCESRFYAHSRSAFTTAGATNGPLQALANGVDGPNGVFRYDPLSSFPDSNYDASNYWVDIAFMPRP